MGEGNSNRKLLNSVGLHPVLNIVLPNLAKWIFINTTYFNTTWVVIKDCQIIQITIIWPVEVIICQKLKRVEIEMMEINKYEQIIKVKFAISISIKCDLVRGV